LLENHEIRALIDNRSETIGKKIRLKCKTHALIVGEEEEKMALYLSVDMARRKRKHYRYE
jgi:threonyl-tRNA synthetase